MGPGFKSGSVKAGVLGSSRAPLPVLEAPNVGFPALALVVLEVSCTPLGVAKEDEGLT